MKKIENLLGQIFWWLRVIEFAYTKNGNAYWLCQCDCGNKTIVCMSELKRGRTKSCGCYNRKIASKNNFIDLTNQTFNRLFVIKFSHRDKYGSSIWKCLCICGKEVLISTNNLRSGHIKSCGCYNKEKHIGKNSPRWKGGHSRLPYPSEWIKELRESIRNRDQHYCQYPECDYDDTKKSPRLHVHHINGDKNNCQEYNLISLCNKHHMKIEKNHPELWQDYFYTITSDYINS